jgi:hypothetical protein
MTRRLGQVAALLLAAAAGAGVTARLMTADAPASPRPVARLEPAAGREVAPAPRPAAPPFRFAGDRGGKQVELALAPAAPAVPPPAVTGPRPRAAAAERTEFALPTPTVAAAPLPVSPRRAARPSPPPERVPAATTVILVVRLPEGPLVADRKPAAAGLPPLARPVPDRVSVEDPTADLSTARIVHTVLPVPRLAVPFLRLMLPDPFELAGQIRLPPMPELATAPVTVPPARP